jgi:SNF2 family DNA or RNA helicase
MVRRRKADVLAQLPPKRRHRVFLDLPAKDRRALDGLKGQLAVRLVLGWVWVWVWVGLTRGVLVVCFGSSSRRDTYTPPPNNKDINTYAITEPKTNQNTKGRARRRGRPAGQGRGGRHRCGG